jgi:hypothetical protein
MTAVAMVDETKRAMLLRGFEQHRASVIDYRGHMPLRPTSIPTNRMHPPTLSDRGSHVLEASIPMLILQIVHTRTPWAS